ncbi:hypothetical protein Pyrde_0390 [Pyrodictium delaneyi]|uniref:DUF4258 domain-containing protein n=1 Tax=Pyrodictium delaneyi TaxID=1273541 RepID=A0A0P0N1K5_9CREN|nr:DUF4258 domain-containing protein [Pyrodictium delaneyi]ALL00440.1 hypothetical protein Pyrde_0390 [Pyrodictium delaneyi]OWJ53917.1 hypothetical protein Pdsh_08485 [Pyrodictium delaneyi]
MVVLSPLYSLHVSKHARERMEERRVSLDEVIEALEDPVQIVYDEENDVYLALGSNEIAVVYAARGRVVEIVTVLRRQEYEALVGRLQGRRYKVVY